MNLRDYYSNDRELLASIPENDQAKSAQQRVLGIAWNTRSDSLTIESDVKTEEKITTQSILRHHAKNFDPLGFLTFLSVKSKIFIQKLWKKNYNCDTQVSEEDRDD